MFILLVLSALLYIFLGNYREGIILLSAFSIIILITYYQNLKTENSLESLRRLSRDSVTDACLKKQGYVAEFEPEPPFLLTLRCFVGVLADQWSRLD
jgi:magnesium-transporting ATPase (P-type)